MSEHAHHHDHGHDHGHAGCCGHDHEEPSAYVRNLWIGGIVLLGLASAWLASSRWTAGRAVLDHPAAFAVTALATVVTGWAFLRGAVLSLVGRRRVSTDTLVGTATVASILLGEAVTGLTVVWLLNLGEHLQGLTLRRTRAAIRKLLALEDDEVWVVTADGDAKRPLAEVVPGDLVVVHAGRKVPVDGTVESGTATINQAAITGENMPVERETGETVYAGTLVQAGEVRVRVVKVGSETAVGRLIHQVEQAQETRAPIQTLGDRFASRFVPFSFVLAGVVFAVTQDYLRALTMLLIACPCAAGLATPTAVSAAIGNGARRGLLIKGGTHLEAAAALDTIVFDKTGTLTAGTPVVQRARSLVDDLSDDEMIRLAASGELHSQHPLALAVVRHAEERGLEIPEHDVCEVVSGRGMIAHWDNGGGRHRVITGSPRLLADNDVAVGGGVVEELRGHTSRGETTMLVAYQERLVGLISVRDTIRPGVREALDDLRRLGVRRQLMLTGDSEASAAAVATEVGLEEWQAGCLPEEKHARIQALRAAGCIVGMVGDGINDAPALAVADLGIAMGTAGSDVAISTADVALASDGLDGTVAMLRLSRRTFGIIRQNYGLAVGVNAGGLVLGALGTLNPLAAALIHNLSTLLVTFNSARLIGYNPASDRGVR